MNTEIAVALIAGAVSIVGSLLANSAMQRKKSQEEAVRDAERETRQADRLDSIDRKLDEHNGYAKRFVEIEKSLAAIDKTQAVIQRDIEYLKNNR